MINLASTSDVLRVNLPGYSEIKCHASWVDLNGTTVTPGRANTVHVTADNPATTTLVAAPAASTVRNVKCLNIVNTSATNTFSITVEHYDGTTAVVLMSVPLAPGETMNMSPDGGWTRRDVYGAEYPPAGLGAFGGFSVPFMKSGTAADVAGCWYCTSKDSGFPGAWSPGTPGIDGRTTDGTQPADYGCIPMPTQAWYGERFLTGVQLASSVAHSHMFFDVLWVNSGISVTNTALQTISSPSLPSRDLNSAFYGEGCTIALLTTTANTNASAIANTTVTYTNSKGASGRTARLTAIAGSQIPASPVVGTIVWFNLEGGDTGVRSIQGITLGTSLVAGAVSLMICRPIATIGTLVANVASQKEIGEPGISLGVGVCMLHCYLASAITATFCTGDLTIMEK